jgi:hypothetical protein
MTKSPPGRASFPGHPTGVFKLLPGKNFKHTWRWLQVRQLREMSPDMTWEDTFNAVAKAEEASKRSVAWQTVESSYKKVENAIKAGNEADFFMSDVPVGPRRLVTPQGVKKLPRN